MTDPLTLLLASAECEAAYREWISADASGRGTTGTERMLGVLRGHGYTGSAAHASLLRRWLNRLRERAIAGGRAALATTTEARA